MDTLYTVVTSPITSVLLSFATLVEGLLLLFQWHKQRAKELAVQNTIFAVRRIVTKFRDSGNQEVAAHSADNALDVINATLATLDTYSPFRERVKRVLQQIRGQLKREAKTKLEELPNEKDTLTEQ